MDNNTRVLFASAMKQFVRGGEDKVDILVREGVCGVVEFDMYGKGQGY